MLYKTKEFNEYFKENFKFFDALEFIAEATQHIPPRGKQYIRRYGLYSSRGRGIWNRLEYCCRLAPQGWKEKHLDNSPVTGETSIIPELTVEEREQKSAWARLIKKVYGVDPLICPKCGSSMKIIAIIMDPEETVKILQHLVKIGRAPPNFDPASLN